MHTEKAHWDAKDNQFTLTMPITKVDKENRIISGFGTLNNVDLQKDIVDAEASRKAFKEWAGNVRMMHDRVPAGKAIDIAEKKFTDESGTEFDGMFVDVYISKGAPNVWEMLLDETLKGFSIGGRINDYEMKQIDGETVRVITDYTLTELSLVDVPANHMAKIMSIQKSASGGIEISSIYDKSSESSVTIEEEETVMTLLSKIWSTVSSLKKGGIAQMDVEKALVQPDTASVVQTDKREAADQWRDADGKYIGNKGGSDIGTAGADQGALRSVKPTDEKVTKEPAKKTATVKKDASDVITSEATTNVENESGLVGTTNDGTIGSVEESDNDTELQKQIQGLNDNLVTVAGIVEKLANRIAGLEKTDNNQQITKTLDEIVDRLKAVESDTATKQSGDIAKSTVVRPQRNQSFWDGAILKTSDL